jgi:DNA polymerase-1
MSQIKKCLIIDGNNLLYRSYHASQHLPWENEFKAIFIFLRIIISLLKENNYQKLLVVFDSAKINFRHHILPGYKIHRLATPPQFLQQMDCLQEIFVQSNIPLAKLANFEADDLIASFTSQNSKSHPDWKLDIFSQDKDLMQLLSPQVSIYRYDNKREIVPFTYSEFCQEYKFAPSSYVDYLCLLGDKSDNIRGINGIGIKSAQQLIQKFGTVEMLYQSICQLPVKKQNLLTNSKQLVYQNKQLITLRKDLTLPINWEECDFSWEKWKSNQKLIEFCQEHQFKSILKLLS